MGKLLRPTISEKLIGIGDSHLDNFTFFCAASCRIPGATSYGLTKPNSDTNAREAFLSFLSSFPSHIPLLCIGEVDCNSLPWRTITTKAPEDFIYQSITSLFSFIKETNRRFILPSVTLPPVDSFKELGIRKFVTSNKVERSSLVKLYNSLLLKNAYDNGHIYLDITTPTTGPNGLVDEYFIHSSSDVHLQPHKLYPIVLDLLSEISYV